MALPQFEVSERAKDVCPVGSHDWRTREFECLQVVRSCRFPVSIAAIGIPERAKHAHPKVKVIRRKQPERFVRQALGQRRSFWKQAMKQRTAVTRASA